MSRKRFSVEQWRVWFAEFDQSDLTVQQFCDLKGTTANTYYNWRRRLQEQPAVEDSSQHSGQPSFVSVKLASPLVEIELGDGTVARVPNDRQSLRPILEVLRELRTQS